MDANETDAITVLIVEDDADLQYLYQQYLEPDYSTQVATTGTEAIAALDGTVDVVLLDRNLPDMSGQKVLETIRESGDDTPVAIITGVEADESIIEMAFDEYVQKPIGQAALRETIDVLVNRAGFEADSRDVFRTAAKVDTLQDATVASSETESVAAAETTLNDTLEVLAESEHPIVARNDPSAAEVGALLEEIHEHSLPETIHAFVAEYQSLADARPPFMWKWVHHLAPRNSLPCVPENARRETAGIKTLLILFITILDDVLEKRHDRETFRRVSQIPFGDNGDTLDDADPKTVEFAGKLWAEIETSLAQTPHYDTYVDLLHFDLKQAINAIEYSEVVIDNPGVATVADLERYESHNMVMLAYADIDLMYTPTDFRDDLGQLREAIMTAQRMARIGNWVSTWERELREGDYSAGPIVYAVENDIVSLETLEAAKRDPTVAEDAIEQIADAGVEKHFLNRWERCYHELTELDEEITSMDLREFIRGTEEVLRYHLASRGLK